MHLSDALVEGCGFTKCAHKARSPCGYSVYALCVSTIKIEIRREGCKRQSCDSTMNIFVLHWKTRKAARWHLDKHVVKMILETCQLLYTAHWVAYFPHLLQQKSAIGLSKAQKQLSVPECMASAPMCQTTNEPSYRPCHVHHPCARWARATTGNYRWLAELGRELAREFRYRFHKVHSCEAHIVWLSEHVPPIQEGERQEFAMAMAVEYQISKNPIVSYRHYYRTSKSSLLKYTGRRMPHWISNDGLRAAHAARLNDEPRLNSVLLETRAALAAHLNAPNESHSPPALPRPKAAKRPVWGVRPESLTTSLAKTSLPNTQ